MRVWRFLTRRRGTAVWDRIVRWSGVFALLGIPVALLVPRSGPLVAFYLMTVWVNGPIAPFLPATYEPILMLYGRLYAPLLVAAIGTAGTLWVEYINYHVYREVLGLDALARLRESPIVRRTVGWFERAPFFTVWLCSWSILPYWTVRFLSPLSGYPVRRQLLATLLGRFPRLWFFAALGVWWDVSATILLAIATGAILVAVIVWFTRRGEKDATEVAGEAARGCRRSADRRGRIAS